jgi:hypothetical protein
MSDKFLMEIDGVPDFNVLAIDDYMRRINDEQTRRELIRECGGTPDAIREFEQIHDIPSGAFELAIMLEDPRVRDMNSKIISRYADIAQVHDQVKMAQYHHEMMSFYSGLSKLYPNAIRFLSQYQILTARLSGSRGVNTFDGEIYQCQFVWPIVAVAAFVVALAVIVINIIAAANAVAAANAIALANVNITGE